MGFEPIRGLVVGVAVRRAVLPLVMSAPKRKRDELRLHASPIVRVMFASLGFVSLGLGIIGAFLPVMPTTVFILIAAYCFARSSERFYVALITNRHFGPMVVNWQENRCMTRKSKTYAITLIALTFTATTILVFETLVARLLFVSGGVALVAYLLSLPTCPQRATRAGVSDDIPGDASLVDSAAAQPDDAAK